MSFVFSERRVPILKRRHLLALSGLLFHDGSSVYRSAFVHSAIAFRHLVEGQYQVEDFARLNLIVPNQVDQLR